MLCTLYMLCILCMLCMLCGVYMPTHRRGPSASICAHCLVALSSLQQLAPPKSAMTRVPKTLQPPPAFGPCACCNPTAMSHPMLCRPKLPEGTVFAAPGSFPRESPHAAAARAAAAAAGPTLAHHPAFPDLPASVPLTYTLSMHACLSERPTERPSFAQVATLLRDVVVEVSDGCYVNSHARVQVRFLHLLHQII